jgi:hypothetical protein
MNEGTFWTFFVPSFLPAVLISAFRLINMGAAASMNSFGCRVTRLGEFVYMFTLGSIMKITEKAENG